MPHDASYFSACLASYVVLMNDAGKVYMLRRTNTSWMNGAYNIPAGKVERHETFLEAAVREAKEEAGVDINPADLDLFLIQNRFEGDKDKNPDWVDAFFIARKWSGEPHIAEPEKSDIGGWYAVNDASIDVIPNIRDAFSYLESKKASFVAFNAPEYAAQNRSYA